MRVLYNAESKMMEVRSAELEPLGSLPYTWEVEPSSVVFAEVSKTTDQLSLTYLGPKDLFS